MQLKDCFEKALEASRELNCVSASKIDRTLTALADAAEKHGNQKQRPLGRAKPTGRTRRGWSRPTRCTTACC